MSDNGEGLKFCGAIVLFSVCLLVLPFPYFLIGYCLSEMGLRIHPAHLWMLCFTLTVVVFAWLSRRLSPRAFICWFLVWTIHFLIWWLILGRRVPPL